MAGNSSLDTIINDAKLIITNPVGFYRQMAKTGGLADPIIFLLVMAFISGVLIAVLSMIGLGSIGMGAGGGIMVIIMMPIMALIGSFIGAAILFVIWKLMGSDENYEVAFRCVAYSSAIIPIATVLSIIPYLGTLIKILWGTYLMVIASIEVHQLPTKTVYIVFGVLAFLGVIFNLSTEYSARNMSQHLENYGSQIEALGKQLENNGDITPEEAGKAMGEFLKGLEKATQSGNE